MFGDCLQLHLGKKIAGKHPTQKPLALLSRIILASTKPNAWILDPFTGSSTTGIAANLFNRKFVGIDKEESFLQMSIKRKLEIENPQTAEIFRQRLSLDSNLSLLENL